MTNKKIELEDLWKITPKTSKAITILFLIGFIICAPFIKSSNITTESNVYVIKKQGQSGAITTLDKLKENNETVTVHQSIQITESGFCFSKFIDEKHGRITCPVSNTMGTINKVSEYSIKNGKINEAYYFYEPVKSAKYGLVLILWFLLIVVPVYIHTIKNADLSQLKERTGKRKFFNFKS